MLTFEFTLLVTRLNNINTLECMDIHIDILNARAFPNNALKLNSTHLRHLISMARMVWLSVYIFNQNRVTLIIIKKKKTSVVYCT